MKKILFTLILSSSFLIQSDNSKTIDKLTVDELTQIVRVILQETLEKCERIGSMEGRAKVNLAVIGSVEAKMYCNFEEISEEISKDLSQPGQ